MTPASHLPRGVVPGQVALPASRAHGPLMPSPAAWPATRRPRDVVADLAAQLRALRVTAHMYAAADPDRGVLSLPQLTIWATGRSLSWTRHGHPVTWPAAYPWRGGMPGTPSPGGRARAPAAHCTRTLIRGLPP